MEVGVLGLIVAGSVLGGVVGLGIAGLAWRNRDVPGATAFALMAGAISLWCFVAPFQVFAEQKLTVWVLDRLVRTVTAQIGPLFLVFILSYAGRDEWLTPRRLALVWLYPVLFVFLSWSAPLGWHGLASTPESATLTRGVGFTAYAVPGDPANAVMNLVAYAMIAVALLVLWRLIVKSRRVHRMQVIALAVGTVLPAGTHLAHELGFTLHPSLNVAPSTFVLSGLAIGWALFRHDFLSVTPMASDVLVDELPDPVVLLDEDDHVVDHNPAASSAFEVDVLVDAHVSEFAPGLDRAIAADDVYSIPRESATDGGVVAHYDPQETAIEDQHGTPRGRMVVLRDVTGQQRQQARLEALQSATQQFIEATTEDDIATLAVDFAERALSQHAAGVFLHDEEASVLEPAAVTDYARQHFDDAELIVAPDTGIYRSYVDGEQRTFDAADDSPFERYAVYPIGEHGVLIVGSPDAGSFATDDVQFASILARTTQVALSQVERERELRRSRRSVERRSEQIEFFNGVLRHSLRNALLVIRGRAEYLREHVEGDLERHIDRIEQWCADLADLTDDIRTINQTVTSSEAERLDDVDLSAMLRDRTDVMGEEFGETTVSVDVPPDVYVQANELLSEVIDSLVVNAVRHNDSEDPHVHVTAVPSDDWVQVRIADNGPGISDDLKERIFERDVATTQTSHGFGLYFVSVMMNLYNGAVWFEDNEPRGTIAVLEFQARDPEAEPPGTKVEAADPDAE